MLWFTKVFQKVSMIKLHCIIYIIETHAETPGPGQTRRVDSRRPAHYPREASTLGKPWGSERGVRIHEPTSRLIFTSTSYQVTKLPSLPLELTSTQPNPTPGNCAIPARPHVRPAAGKSGHIFYRYPTCHGYETVAWLASPGLGAN